jgi:hypothetical protein
MKSSSALLEALIGGVFLEPGSVFLPPNRKGSAAAEPRVAIESYERVMSALLLVLMCYMPSFEEDREKTMGIRTQCAPTWRPKMLYIATPAIFTRSCGRLENEGVEKLRMDVAAERCSVEARSRSFLTFEPRLHLLAS